ncbi:hypothetical protein QR680_014181 [Steinernema hermaphroditum]|uniref:Uncharacterized protein n=1 Tax=Steinernema hermaphroditum TaxID=289476 RepID=A0AA39M3S1_9BILA|nr:hypothetical protein QR680_014181 [Steinernema hermaphroditum]
MDNIPPTFYEQLFGTLPRTACFEELDGPIGRLAKQANSRDKYHVQAHIADQLSVLIAVHSNDGIRQCSLMELPFFFSERQQIVSFVVHVFEDFPQHEEDEQRGRYVVPKELFEKAMKTFAYARDKNVSCSNISLAPIPDAYVLNFDTYKKYLLACHSISALNSEVDASNQYFSLLQDLLRSPSLKVLSLSNAQNWPDDWLDAIFDFLSSPNSEICFYSHWIDGYPPDFISKWMDLQGNVPSRKKLSIDRKDMLFLKKFAFEEIWRTMDERFRWIDTDGRRLEKAPTFVERDPRPLRRFFRLQHPEHRQHCLIVAVGLPTINAANISKEELFAVSTHSDYYFI